MAAASKRVERQVMLLEGLVTVTITRMLLLYLQCSYLYLQNKLYYNATSLYVSLC